MLQDFKSVSDHFGTLCIKGLNQSQNYVIFIQIVSCKCVFHKWVYLQGVIGGLVDFVTGVGVVAVATETKEIINH